MTEATLVQFDEAPRGAAHVGPPATERIAATLKNAGIDAPNSLYDEALALARDGHLGQAHARLQMLLCLDPDDAAALLLLSKVYAAQGRPVDALSRLDAAVSAGGLPPAGYRDQLEGAIRAERAREEEHRARIAAREQGEIRSLRDETRTLRSEQVRLETEVNESRVRERNWKYAAFGTSVVFTLVLLVLSATRGPSTPEAAVQAAPAPPSAAAGEVSEAPAAPAAGPSEAAAPSPAGEVPAAPVASAPAPVGAKVEPAPAAAAPKMKGCKGTVHVVESGDTFAIIAAAGGVTPEAIQKANPKVSSNRMQIGQQICVPKR